jgi:VWFA-related protein
MTTGRVAIGVAAAVLSTSLLRGQEQVFRSTSDAVSVDVSVRSGSRPVRGLTPDDFRLSDNGVPQKVQVVTTESLPLDVSLVLDVSASVRGPLLSRLKGGVEDVARRLNTNDRLRLLAISASVREVFDFHAGGAVPSLTNLDGSGSTALFDGVIAALVKTRAPDRRHLIVAFTDGRDTASFFDTKTVADVALKTDSVVHFVVGEPGLAANGGEDREVTRLGELAATTGGQVLAIDLNSSIAEAFKRVIDDFRTSYVLQYRPELVTPAGWHEIAVSIARAGRFDVRARKGYFGGLP